MPGHGGVGPGSRCRRCRVPCAGRTLAVAPCLLCEVLAVILVLRGRSCACAHSCVAPASELWFLGASLPSTGFCGGGAGPGLPGPARLDSSLLQSWCLVPWSRASSSVRLPSVSLPWVGSIGGFWVCLHFLKWSLYSFCGIVCCSFLGNLSLRLRWRLIPSLPRAPCIFMPGLSRKRGWECWSGSSSTSLRGS